MSCSVATQQSAALRHRVARIDHQVEDHLLHHARVGLDMRQRRGVMALQVNILADDPVEHLGQVGDDVVQHQRLGLQHLFAAESQQLARQIGRPLRRFHHVL